MRISVDDLTSKDPELRLKARLATVELNGVRIDRVIEADEEKGYVEYFDPNQQLLRVRNFGQVKINLGNCPVKIANYNPWHPMKDPVDLKTLGKLAEEAGELVSAASRCMIQGIDEAEPFTKKINRDWLQDECADVLANIQLVIERFELDQDAITARVVTKCQRLREWHEMA